MQDVRFGEFELLPDQRRLLRRGKPVILGARAYDLLVHLVRHRDRVVGKQELLEQVWPGLAVEEANLTVQVSALRRLLGAEALSTIPGRGYRFVLPAEAAAPATAPAQPVPATPSIAVLPFADLGCGPGWHHVADGLVEDLITTLSHIAGLTVIARASSFCYRGREVDARQVGRELGVGHVLEGSVRTSAGRMRVTARLVDARSGAQVWAERYDRAIEDIFALQDELTLVLVTELQVRLADGEQARLRYASPRSVEAWGYWARGLACYRRAVLTRAGMTPALMDWQKAAALDPRSAAIQAMLGMLYYLDARFGFWNDRAAAVGRGEEHVGRALSLDPHCADAQMVRGLLLLLQRRHDEAVEAARLSLDCGPRSADVAAFASFVLANAGLGQEAAARIDDAVRLCPIVPAFYWGHMGLAYREAGRTADGIAAFTRYQAASPGRGVTDLVVINEQLGREDEARRWAAVLRDAFPDFRIGAWRETQFRRDREALEADAASLRAMGLPD